MIRAAAFTGSSLWMLVKQHSSVPAPACDTALLSLCLHIQGLLVLAFGDYFSRKFDSQNCLFKEYPLDIHFTFSTLL